MDKHQFAEFASRVIANLPRDIPSGYASHLIGNPGTLRRILEKGLLVPEFGIAIPALPARSVQKWERFQYEGVRVLDTAPVVPVTMRLHFARRGELNHHFLGLQHALWIEEHQHKVPILWPGEFEILFSGTTVSDANGRPYVPSLVPRPQYDNSYMMEWTPAERFGRGDAYVAIAERRESGVE